jgi:hypothetical protein
MVESLLAKISLELERRRFASVEDLIIHQVFAGRPRDLEDVRGILLKNSKLDLTYLRRWLREFDRSAGEGFLDRFEKLCQRGGEVQEQ